MPTPEVPDDHNTPERIEASRRQNDAVHVGRRGILRLIVLVVFGICAAAFLRDDEDSKPERPQPDVVARDPELRKFLEQDFEVISGTSSIEDAKVICWGDFHFYWHKEGKANEVALDSTHRIAEGLNRTVDSGDLILMEGLDPTNGRAEIPSMMLPLVYPGFIHIYDREGISVRGWDSDALIKQSKRAKREDDWHKIKQLAAQRNTECLFPRMLAAEKENSNTVHVIAGLWHVDDDVRIDNVLQARNIPFIILGTKKAQEFRRRR